MGQRRREPGEAQSDRVNAENGHPSRDVGTRSPWGPPTASKYIFCTDEIVWIENKIGAKRKFLWWQQVGKRRGSSGHEAEDRGVTPDLLLVHLLSAAAARGRVG